MKDFNLNGFDDEFLARLKHEIDEDVRFEAMTPDELDGYLRANGCDPAMIQAAFEAPVHQQMKTLSGPSTFQTPRQNPIEQLVEFWDRIREGTRRTVATFLPGSLEMTWEGAVGGRTGGVNPESSIDALKQALTDHGIPVKPTEFEADGGDLYLTVYYVKRRPDQAPKLEVSIGGEAESNAEWADVWSSFGPHMVTLRIIGLEDQLEELRQRPLTLDSDDEASVLRVEFE